MKTNILILLVGFLATVEQSHAQLPISSTLAEIRMQYSTMESNWISIVQSDGVPKKQAFYGLALIGSTNILPIAWSNPCYTEHTPIVANLNGIEIPLGQLALDPGWVYPALVVFQSSHVPLNDYLTRISEGFDNSREMDIFLWAAHATYGSNFLERVQQLKSIDSNRWSHIEAKIQTKCGWWSKLGECYSFGLPEENADRETVQPYGDMKKTLECLAVSACKAHNGSNLVDIVSTFRFIHAPIPEAVSTNDFFQTTIGEE